MTKKEIVCITGGTGLLGSHLCELLANEGYEIYLLSRRGRFAVSKALPENSHLVQADIRDSHIVEQMLEQCDILIHHAGFHGLSDADGDLATFTNVNVGGTEILTRALKRGGHRVQRVILASSASVYGEGQYNCAICGLVQPKARLAGKRASSVPGVFEPLCPLCSGDVETVQTLESAELTGLSEYALSKIAQEQVLWQGCNQIDIPIAIFRYGTVYGEGQSASKPYSKMSLQLLQGKPITIHEDGHQSRDYIYVKDAVTAPLHWLRSSQKSDIFNVGTGHQTSIKDYISLLVRALRQYCPNAQTDAIIDFEIMPAEARRLSLDCTKINSMGFAAKVGPDVGTERFVTWFAAQHRALCTIDPQQLFTSTRNYATG